MYGEPINVRLVPKVAYHWPLLGVHACHDGTQVQLAGSAVVRLAAHAEDYFLQLPGLMLEDPVSATCRPNLTGT